MRFLEELLINYTKVLLEGIDILYSFAKRTVNANRDKKDSGQALLPGLLPQVARWLTMRARFLL